MSKMFSKLFFLRLFFLMQAVLCTLAIPTIVRAMDKPTGSEFTLDWETQLEQKQNSFVSKYNELLASEYFQTMPPEKLLPADFSNNFEDEEQALVGLVEELQQRNDAQAWQLLHELGDIFYLNMHEEICSLNLTTDNQNFLLDVLQNLYTFEVAETAGKIKPFNPTLTKLTISIHVIQDMDKTAMQKEKFLSLALHQITKEILTINKKYNFQTIGDDVIKKFVLRLQESFVCNQFVAQDNAKKHKLKKIIICFCVATCVAAVAGFAWYKIKQSKNKSKDKEIEEEREAQNSLTYKLGQSVGAFAQTIEGTHQSIQRNFAKIPVHVTENVRQVQTKIQQTLDTMLKEKLQANKALRFMEWLSPTKLKPAEYAPAPEKETWRQWFLRKAENTAIATRQGARIATRATANKAAQYGAESDIGNSIDDINKYLDAVALILHHPEIDFSKPLPSWALITSRVQSQVQLEINRSAKKASEIQSTFDKLVESFRQPKKKTRPK